MNHPKTSGTLTSSKVLSILLSVQRHWSVLVHGNRTGTCYVFDNDYFKMLKHSFKYVFKYLSLERTNCAYDSVPRPVLAICLQCEGRDQHVAAETVSVLLALCEATTPPQLHQISFSREK